MKYERFEDLPVWQAAADLAAKLLVWSDQAGLRGKGDFANQLQRAALSISNNIAEGFERGTTKELIHFLYIARGSAGEVRSMLGVLERMQAVSDLSTPVSDFKAACESISKQLRGWAGSLQNSDIAGQRFLNDRSRAQFEYRQRLDRYDNQHRQWRSEFEARLKAQAAQRAAAEVGNTAETEYRDESYDDSTSKPDDSTSQSKDGTKPPE